MLIMIYRTWLVSSCECVPSSALSAWGATELAIWRLSQGLWSACREGSDGVNNGRFFESQLMPWKSNTPSDLFTGVPAQNEWPTGFPWFSYLSRDGNSDDPCSGNPNASLYLHFNQQTFRFDFKRLLLRVSLGTVRLAATTFFASMPGSWFLFDSCEI